MSGTYDTKSQMLQSRTSDVRACHYFLSSVNSRACWYSLSAYPAHHVRNELA